MTNKVFTFQNDAGNSLSGQLEVPFDQNPVAYAIFAHCFTCNKDFNAVRSISKALTQRGFGVLRFDFTGLGESQGAFADTNFSSNVQDLIAAVHAMEAAGMPPQLLVGHSLGGAASLFAANELPAIKAVATIGAPANPKHVSHLFESSMEEIEKNQEARVNIGGKSLTIKKQFIEDIKGKSAASFLPNLNKALLILHSPQDKIVGIENATQIYKLARHPKSYVSLDGAGHLLRKRHNSRYAGDLIASWASRYISAPKKAVLRTKEQVVVQIGETGFTTEIKAGNHSFRADEPVAVGGDDYGPSPYDLLLASLGSCTAMTLRMYADRKKWAIKNITIHMNHKKTYQEDCQNCQETTSKVDVIERHITIQGAINEEQKDRLLAIADKCPVHRTLHSNIQVQTFFVNT